MAAGKSDRRVLVIGLDGATLDLVEPWAAAGKLPVLAALMQRGAWARLRSVLPVLSPSAWASFLTGVNPGRHGIYDFIRRAPGGYGLRLTHLGHNRAQTAWRILNAQGRKTIVLNVPTTYPPEPLDGIMASGLGTPAFKPFTYPEAMGAELERHGYRVDCDLAYQPGREEAFLRGQMEHTRRQADAALWLMRAQPWDLFCYVIRGTDEIPHFYWKYMDATHPAHDAREAAPWRDAVLEYYQLCDRLAGEMLETAGPDTTVFVVSDHGMGPLYRDVFLNEWLRQQGYLVTQSRRPGRKAWLARLGITRQRGAAVLRALGLRRLESALKERLGERLEAMVPRDVVRDLGEAVDWTRTRAYSFGYHGQIYLNVRGREPQGIVASGEEYESLRREIIDKLAGLVDPADGGRVATEVYTAEQLYAGPALCEAPDIVVMMRDLSYITRHGYEFGEAPDEVFSPPHQWQSASHRLNGLWIAAGPGIAGLGREQAAASIMDVLPTLLHVMNLEVPDGLDGRIAEEWLDDEARGRPVRLTEGGPREGKAPGIRDFTKEEEAEVTQRLKDLGYLG